MDFTLACSINNFGSIDRLSVTLTERPELLRITCVLHTYIHTLYIPFTFVNARKANRLIYDASHRIALRKKYK